MKTSLTVIAIFALIVLAKAHKKYKFVSKECTASNNTAFKIMLKHHTEITKYLGGGTTRVTCEGQIEDIGDIYFENQECLCTDYSICVIKSCRHKDKYNVDECRYRVEPEINMTTCITIKSSKADYYKSLDTFVTVLGFVLAAIGCFFLFMVFGMMGGFQGGGGLTTTYVALQLAR